MLILVLALTLTLVGYVVLTVLRRKSIVHPAGDLGHVSERWLVEHRADHHLMR